MLDNLETFLKALSMTDSSLPSKLGLSTSQDIKLNTQQVIALNDSDVLFAGLWKPPFVLTSKPAILWGLATLCELQGH